MAAQSLDSLTQQYESWIASANEKCELSNSNLSFARKAAEGVELSYTAILTRSAKTTKTLTDANALLIGMVAAREDTTTPSCSQESEASGAPSAQTGIPAPSAGRVCDELSSAAMHAPTASCMPSPPDVQHPAATPVSEEEEPAHVYHVVPPVLDWRPMQEASTTLLQVRSRMAAFIPTMQKLLDQEQQEAKDNEAALRTAKPPGARVTRS